MIKGIGQTILVSLLFDIIYIVFGVIMILNAQIATAIIATALGAIFGILGIILIIVFLINKAQLGNGGFSLARGIILLLFSALLFFKYQAILTIIPIILGAIIIINGALKLEYVINIKKNCEANWLVLLVLSILEIILGLVLIFNPFESSLVMTQIIGIFVISYSIIDAIQCVILKIALGKLQNNLSEN